MKTKPKTTALVAVPFHGGHLFAADGEYANPGDRPVPIRPACERLNLAMQPQLRKLDAVAWTCVTKMVMQMPGDDQAREMSCIPLRAFPMWLASINPGKVPDDLRPMLISYQCEAADTLYRRFMPEAASHDTMADLRAELVEAKRDRASLRAELAEVRKMIAARLDGTPTNNIGKAKAELYVQSPLRVLARQMARFNGEKWNSIRGQLESEVRGSVLYFGKLHLMSESMLPAVHRQVTAMQKREARRLKRLPGLYKALPRQLPLALVDANKGKKSAG